MINLFYVFFAHATPTQNNLSSSPCSTSSQNHLSGRLAKQKNYTLMKSTSKWSSMGIDGRAVIDRCTKASGLKPNLYIVDMKFSKIGVLLFNQDSSRLSDQISNKASHVSFLLLPTQLFDHDFLTCLAGECSQSDFIESKIIGESYLNLIVDATDISPEEEYDYIVVGGGTAENYVVNLYEANDRDSPARRFTSEDGIPNFRGRILGGSSMINFGIYSRADGNFYARTGIKWDMGAVKKAYEWVEESVVFGTDKLTTWESSVRDALLESNIGPDNGFTLDHVVGAKVTGATFDQTGRRHGSVELLNKANPENLRVIVNATVEKLNFSSSESSGALGSPQLLLLSGVGPRPHLTSLNIPVVLDQPFISQFMYDPPRNYINLVAPFPIGIESHAIGISRDGFAINDLSGATPFYSPVSEILFPDPSPPINLSVATIAAKLTRIQSSGSLQLASATNISINPNVRFNYFSNPEDLSRCSNMIRYVANMISTPSMEAYKFQGLKGEKSFLFVGTSLAENESDSGTLEVFCRKTLRTIYHYHGGCTIGKVVDSDLKAIGIKALRIVDGSTFPTASGTNPQATLMMLGRYIGLKMKEERSA
ncbi:hypothetical protein RJ639_040724 [Escallonia herrerae]|uniref:Glucose-methanol-choline oxidoreductase N-terminal domain-containing protein n=1 Tax=Escallonia herrerae TaxID=1293975 RepID=A0AA88WF66_9ASTE|nr:hypothetical protein RJ639_040724 [Escallonia herrerae]